MRGAHALLHLLCVMLGIIPAYAGSTRRRYRKPRWSREHPRVCGEHWSVPPPKRIRASGSSPRMRGALHEIAVHVDGVGIIPAYAGSTLVCLPQKRWYRDHPRVCGEHLKAAAKTETSKGSSPRMRGALNAIFGGVCVYGIIPAYAGSTIDCATLRARVGDHPRVCGEHPTFPQTVRANPGSSPRMRGALSLGCPV